MILIKFIIFAICSAIALASSNTCPNTTSSASVSNGITSNTVTIPGVGGGSPANDLGSLGVAGCTAVDFVFSNFAGGTLQNGLTLAGTYLAETPAGTGQNPLTTPDHLLFASVRGAANVATDGNNNDGTNNFIAVHNTTVTDQIAFHVNASGTNPGNKIYGVDLSVFQPGLTTGSTGSVAIFVCTGAQTGVITTAGGCSGTFLSTTLTLSTASSLSTLLNIVGGSSQFQMTTVVTLTGSAGAGNFAGFDAYSFDLIEAPEPSSWISAGIGLAGLLLLKFRRRKS